MKYALIITDGAADVAIDELGGRTPLEAAHTPNIDWIASNGRVGSVRTIPRGMSCGSDVAILSLLGYDPREHYTGRAPLEAAAQGLKVGPDEWVLRCNLVTIIDGRMEDYSAGHISSEEAAALVTELNRQLGSGEVTFHTGVSYRHLMRYRGRLDVTTTPPHDILGKPVGEHMPTGAGSDLLKALIERSAQVLGEHEVNAVRRDLGENPATHAWLWGQGQMPRLPAFADRFGVRGVAVTAVDLVRGIARLIGWDVLEVPGATGYIDTNYAGKGAAAVEALDGVDMVCVHVEAPDEAGHNANVSDKVHAIEQIDRHVVGPLLERLRREGQQWRVLVMPDHPTPCALRTHTGEPVPFALAGLDVPNVVPGRMTERAAAGSDLHVQRGCDLMEFFLTVR